MKKYSSIFLAFVVLACQQDSGSITTLYSLPKKLKEVSGIIYSEKTNVLWTLEDSGNANARRWITREIATSSGRLGSEPLPMGASIAFIRDPVFN